MSLCFIPTGGLGNLLFMHHAAYSYAKDNGMELYAPAEHPTDRFTIFHYRKLFSHVKFLPFYPQPNYYDPILAKYTPIPPGVNVISGFFQSFKYFSKYGTEIRDLLRSNEIDTWKEVNKTYNDLSNGKQTLCLHIRRGDAIGCKQYILLQESYYLRASNIFTNCKFIVFSDEIEKVKDWNIWKSHDVHFVNEPDSIRAFFLMSLCDNFIIANSTFSLSAYYMRENIQAKLIAPKEWFGPEAVPPCNITVWDDLLPEEVILC